MKIKYDGTAPTVAGTPARKPDANGWYNHPVDVAYTGTDGGSGVIECSPTVTSPGPDANPAELVGQCRDAAGHLSEPTTVELRYDGTPPARPNVKWVDNGESISLAWTADKDVVQAKVVRAPGLKGKKPGVVYQGRARKLVDRKLRSGARVLVRDHPLRPGGECRLQDGWAQAGGRHLHSRGRRGREEAAAGRSGPPSPRRASTTSSCGAAR